MGANYIFSLTPTFTQGLIIGQLSILLLLAVILKYLFLDSGPTPPYDAGILQQLPVPVSSQEKDRSTSRTQFTLGDEGFRGGFDETESAQWFNVIVRQITESYRSKLRNDVPGAEGEENARQRIEQFANKFRPEGFVDPIRVLAVDLGASAPHVTGATLNSASSRDEIELALSYSDTVSVTISTSVLFHYPVPYFIRLPITLSICLGLFSARVKLIPPDPNSQNPTLTVSLLPDFVLDLKTSSLMGSRAKLADVPKLHEMIQAQIRRALLERGTWKIVLPWVASVEEVKEELATSAQDDSISSVS
ncbi:hypothetical protein SCHPADRAFT_903287 [Schizopora paradoxa]|uniref:Maintenance of mitochondrial morphology protein 1 n=1 Tax=Schizopora paradoxa TaxID=27342 RepID=A0A0H2RR99_9AGAM|nr:hypothetical protein SCHPADRAFT_903287 [Schizopora paradoxa]